MTLTPPIRPSGLTTWPNDAALTYRRAGAWADRLLTEEFNDWCLRSPDAIAVIAGAEKLTYTQLATRVARRAAGWSGQGIRPGDRVLVQVPNRIEFPIVLLSLIRVGAVPILTMPAHRHREITALARRSGAVAYVTVDRERGFDYRDLATEVQSAAPQLRHVFVDGDPGPHISLAHIDADPASMSSDERADPGDIALLLLSGGTTGVPKLIPRTHNDYAFNARASAELCCFDSHTVYLAALPAAHNFVLACPGILGTWASGGTVVLASSPAPDECFTLIAQPRVTHTALVPSLVQVWLDAAEWEHPDLSSLGVLQAGGSRLPASLARRARTDWQLTVQQVYGMAEGLLNFTRLDDPDDLTDNTQGRPLSSLDEIRIVDEHGQDVPDGEDGELWTRGPYTIRGYVAEDEVNQRTFSSEGFYRSGDRVRRLGDGNLIVSGRVNETISKGGESIATDDITDILREHPAISDCAVVGIAGDGVDQRICAVIVSSGTPPVLTQLREFLLSEGIAAHKLPDVVECMPALPLTTIGKIDANAIRQNLGLKKE